MSTSHPLATSRRPPRSPGPLSPNPAPGTAAAARAAAIGGGSPLPCARLATALLAQGEPFLAYDLLNEGLARFPGVLRLRQLFALALLRSGAGDQAREHLARLYAEGDRSEETLGLLARTYKETGLAAPTTPAGRRALRRAFDLYAEAFAATPTATWSGINAATLRLFLGQPRAAATLANKVALECEKLLSISSRQRTRSTPPDPYWLLATLGEAALVAGDLATAQSWYRQARAAVGKRWADLATSRRQAGLVAAAHGIPSAALTEVFAVPPVVVFAGHMLDRPGRSGPRFPATAVPAVRRALAARLAAIAPGQVFSAAACGADILCLEAATRRGTETHVVLPLPPAAFLPISVAITPRSAWTGRFHRALARASSCFVASEDGQPDDPNLFAYGTTVLNGLASERAERLGARLVPLAVWDGQPGDGRGGTADFVAFWRQRGLGVEIIDPRHPDRGEADQDRDGAFPPAVSPARDTPAKNPARAPRPGPATCGAPRPATVPAAAPGGPMTRAEAASPTRSRTPSPALAPTPAPSCTRALLFADALHFSRLSELQLPAFINRFLGAIGEETARRRRHLVLANTWGDGLFFVFDSLREAGLFALDLAARVGAGGWSADGLPDALSLRIALHAGPVRPFTDPITGRPNVLGSHVNRAARIEPVTPPGQVYTTRGFAALAAAEGIRDFRCDYVGQVPLAKGYGTFPLYHLCRTPSRP